MKAFTLSSKEKLKSRKSIDRLFKEGKQLSLFPVKQVYIIHELPQGQRSSLFSVSVPKRNFKKAVDRNKIKRLFREAYRLNCLQLKEELAKQQKQIMIMYIYVGREIPDYHELEQKIITLIERTIKRL